MNFSLEKDWCLHLKTVLTLVSKSNISVFYFSQNYPNFWILFLMWTITICNLRLLGIVVHRQLLGHYQETIQAYIVDNGYLYSIPHDSGSSQETRKPWFHVVCRYAYLQRIIFWPANPVPEDGGSISPDVCTQTAVTVCLTDKLRTHLHSTGNS